MTGKALLAAAAVMVVGVVAMAKELPPAGGEPRQYKLPDSETLRFDNGLRLTMVPFGAIPKVTISVAVQTGNLNEGDDTWLADLTGEMMIEGAGARDTVELAAAVANMGGQLGINVGIDRTTIGADVLAEFGAQAVRLIADVVREPALPASELVRVRDNMLKNLAIAATQPQTQADEAFRQLIYGDHPYGVGLPDAEKFAALNIDDVRGYHGENFGALRTHVYVAGRFDRDTIVTALRDSFAAWPAGAAPVSEPPTKTGFGKTHFIDRPGAPQSTIYVGLPVSDPSQPDYIQFSVLNTLLGGSFISRITRNIREDKGYTYSPRSRVVSRFRSAYWVQTADVTTEATGPALAEIFGEIRRLRREAPPADELSRVQNYRTGTFVLGNATRAGLIGQLQFLDGHGLDKSYLTKFVARLNSVRSGDIQTLAMRYLHIDQMALVIVGDLETVLPQLESLDDVDIDIDYDPGAAVRASEQSL